MINAEYLLLHALTVRPDLSLTLDLEAEHFVDANGRVLYGVIRNLAAKGKPFDILAAKEAGADLRFTAELMRAGVGHPDNAEDYAAKVRAAWKLRELARIGTEMAGEAEAAGADPDQLAGGAISRLNELARSAKGFDFDMQAVAMQVTDFVERAHEAAANGKTIGIPTGIGRLDTALGGLHPTDLVICAARPGMGKTAFGMGVAEFAARKGYRVGFVSAEMPSEQLGTRLAAMIGAVDYSRIRNGRLREEDWPRLMDGLAKMAKLPVRIYAQPGCRMGDVIRQAMAWKLSGGLDLLLVDYLQRIRPDRELERADLTIGQMAQDLKNCAANLNVPVLCFAQLNRGVDNRADKRPLLSDLRGSGEIEQEADSVLMLYRPAAYDEHADARDAEILVEKNRHGETGLIRASFDGPLMRWGDAVEDYRPYAREAVA